MTEAPRPELERPTITGEATNVRVGLYIIDVDTIDSANQNFSASIYYEARWNSPALKHDGPGRKIMSTSEAWTPNLAIVNQQQYWNAFPSQLEVYPDGTVIYRQKTWGWFSQPLDLRAFPRDRQTLTVQIAAAGMLASDVIIEPLEFANGRRSGMASTFSLPDFKVVSFKAEPRAFSPFEGEKGVAGFVAEIVADRNTDFFFWKLIIPLCLIVVMSWAPHWISREEIGTSIGIAATSFLTLVAYLFATAGMLPRISYMTKMDAFTFLATAMVFVSLLQTVLLSSVARTLGDMAVVRITQVSRILYPILLLMILYIFFGN